MAPGLIGALEQELRALQEALPDWLVWVSEPVTPPFYTPSTHGSAADALPPEMQPNIQTGDCEDGAAVEVLLRATVLPAGESVYRPPRECYPGIRVQLAFSTHSAYPAVAPVHLPRVTIRSNFVHHANLDNRHPDSAFYLGIGCAGSADGEAAHRGWRVGDKAASGDGGAVTPDKACPEPAGTASAVLWHVAHTLFGAGAGGERPTGTPELRFSVGDKVEANVGRWVPATVVAIWDEGETTPAPQPYRLQLDSEPGVSGPADDAHPVEVWAPDDTDVFVRAPMGSDLAARTSLPSRERAAHVWWDLADATATHWAVIASYPRDGHPLTPDLFLAPPAPSLDYWAPKISPGIAAWLRSGGPAAGLSELITEEGPNIFSFELFSPEFCGVLLAEIERYEGVAAKRGWTIRRPNSMNAYGAILNEIGLESFADSLQDTVLAAVAQALFGPQGATLTHHHTFMVSYEPGHDLGLDMHTDDSDVTFNVCLGKEFTGAGLQFCGVLGDPDHRQASARYQHKVGRCVVHLGAQRHGADDIESGMRRNLIIWNTNEAWRRSLGFVGPQFQLTYAREQGLPDEVCLSYTHDKDWEAYRGPRPESARGYRPWCPPDKARFVPQ